MIRFGYEPIERREIIDTDGTTLCFEGELGLFEDSFENANLWEVCAGKFYVRADLSAVCVYRKRGKRKEITNFRYYLTSTNRMVNHEMARRGWESDGYVLTYDGIIAPVDSTVTLGDGRVFHRNGVAVCQDTGKYLPCSEMLFLNGAYRLKEAVEKCEHCGCYKEFEGFCPHCDTVLADGTHAPRALTSRYLVYRKDKGVCSEYCLKEKEVGLAGHEKCVLCETWFPKNLVTNCVCYQCLGCEMDDGDAYDPRLGISGKADITGYHSNDKDEWYGKPDKHGRFEGLGFELEVDGNPKSVFNRSLYNNLFAHDLMKKCGLGKYECVFETDGSLDTGFEIISMPHTVDDFWKKKDNWTDMLAVCRMAGFKSHDTATCGLHVHVSRDMFGKSSKEIGYRLGKIHRLYSERWEDFVKVSRRKVFRHCQKNMETDVKGGALSVRDGIGKWKYVRNGKHGYAINDDPDMDTVEFRLCRGTLNPDSFFAWIDLTLTIVRNSRKGDRKLRNILEWLDGMRGETWAYLRKVGAFVDATGTYLEFGGGV